MKKIFKKAMTVLGSAAMLGATVGSAFAAAYPSPFTSNTAIVVGTGAGASDSIAIANVKAGLTALSTASKVTNVEGGESFRLQKSNEFNFGDALNSVYSNLYDDEMDFLSAGDYNDGAVDSEYTQKITLGTKTLSVFADTNYNDDDASVGFYFTNGQEIMNYTIEFDTLVNYTEMVGTDMPLLNKKYYVLAASASQIDVLDSAESTTVYEGSPVEVNGKSVSIYSIDANGVRFAVDGEKPSKLTSIGDYEKLDDDTYIVLKDWTYDTRDGKDSYAEFSIGMGKIELITADEIKVNGEDLQEMWTTITSSDSKLDSLTISWKSDKETFVTEDSVATMPGFESIQLVYSGLEFPEDPETISFDAGSTLEVLDVPVMYWNDTNAFLGEEDHELVVATSTATNTTWTSPARTANLTGGLDLEVGDRFYVTDMSTALGDIKTMYYEVTTVENDSNVLLVELDDLAGSNDIDLDTISEAKNGPGSMTVTLTGINGTTSGARAYLTFSGEGTIAYNKIVSDKGLVVTLPTGVSSVGESTAATFTLIEADKYDDVGAGRQFTIDVKANSAENLYVSAVNLSSGYMEKESSSSDVYTGYVPSEFASKLTWDKSDSDGYDFSVEYYGGEVIADVMVVADGTVSTSTEAAVMTVNDNEVSDGYAKNLIVVGGSAINSVAAELLGDAYRGEAFTAATGIAAGEALIASYASPYSTGKTALLVAGYNAEDTEKAVTYLLSDEEDIETSVGTKLKITSSTEGTTVATEM